MNRIFRFRDKSKDLDNSPLNLKQHDGTGNSIVISKLQCIINNGVFGEEELSEFTNLVINEFDWRNAVNDDVDKCKNMILDLIIVDCTCINYLLQRLISQFRSSDKEHLKVDICGKTFDSILLLKKHLRQILMDSPDDIELDGDNYDLLFELLKYHPRLDNFRQNVVSIYPSTNKNPKFNGLRCYFYRLSDGSCEYFSYARCSDNVKTRGEIFREYISDIIIEIYKLYPNILNVIMDILESLYPHHNIAIEHHVSVTKAILYISRHIIPGRLSLYRLLINKLTIIDAEIKLEDPNSIDVVKVENLRSQKLKELADKLRRGDADINETRLQLENPNWFKSIYEKLRTEEDIDDMSQKLDVLMGILFHELQHILNENINVPAKGGSFSRCLDSSFTASEVESLTPMKSFESSRSNGDVNIKRDDGIFAVVDGNSTVENGKVDNVNNPSGIKRCSSLPVVKDTAQTPTLRNLNSCISFDSSEASTPPSIKREYESDNEYGTFYSVSDMIVMDLINVFVDIVLPTYNCKYVQFIYFYISSLNERWCRFFLQRLFVILFDTNEHVIKRRTALSYISSLVCRCKYMNKNIIYTVVNYLFKMLSVFDYILLKSTSLKNDKVGYNNNRNVGEIKLPLSLLYSLLQSILYICCYRIDILSESWGILNYLQDDMNGFMGYLDSYLYPLSYFKSSIITTAINVTNNNMKFKKLNNYLIECKKSYYQMI